MRTQVLCYKFDTLTKPGKIICHGIRIETVELDNSDDQIKVPLLCEASAPLGFKAAELIYSLQKNFRA